MPISIDEYFDEIKEEEQRAQRYEQFQTQLEQRAEKAVSTIEETTKPSAAKDSFTKTGQHSENPSGVYRITKDADGERRIDFTPTDNEKAAAKNGDGTAREIQQLKQEQSRIEL